MKWEGWYECAKDGEGRKGGKARGTIDPGRKVLRGRKGKGADDMRIKFFWFVLDLSVAPANLASCI